LKTGLASYLL